jgi:hypothetical protein
VRPATTNNGARERVTLSLWKWRPMNHIQIIKDAFEIYGREYKSLGDYSATSLIDPPRKVQLTKRYGAVCKPTIESQIAAMIGTAVHEKMEKLLRLANVKNPDYMLERNVVHPFDCGREEIEIRLVAGRFDILYKEEDLYDIKTVKTWKLIFDPDMKDWHEQQNIYAYLLRERGIEIKTLNIVAFYLDWIEANAIRDKNYPQSPIVQYKLKLWDWQETAMHMHNRLNMHVSAEHLKDEDLPECTLEERWERLPEYALMKNPKAKRATKVIRKGTFEDALREARSTKGMGNDSFIEVRHSTRKRCEKYCKVKDYCSQYQEYARKKNSQGLNTIFPLSEVL